MLWISGETIRKPNEDLHIVQWGAFGTYDTMMVGSVLTLPLKCFPLLWENKAFDLKENDCVAFCRHLDETFDIYQSVPKRGVRESENLSKGQNIAEIKTKIGM